MSRAAGDRKAAAATGGVPGGASPARPGPRPFPQSDDPFRLLFEGRPVPVRIDDLETLRSLAVRDAAFRRRGCSGDESLATTIRGIRPPEDVPALRDTAARGGEGLHEALLRRVRQLRDAPRGGRREKGR